MRQAISASVAVLGLGSLASGCFGGAPDRAPAAGSDRPIVVAGEGAGWRPGETIGDWATYADYVLAVTPTAESELPPTQGEINRGEGLIQRRLTLVVEDVVWSSTRAERPAPRSMPFVASGWRFTDGNLTNRTEMALNDAPRVETGHHYLMAVAWQEARCSPGDEPSPARWRALGSDAIVPFDESTVGLGENQGQAQSVSQAAEKANDPGPDISLEGKLAGKSTRDVRLALQSTRAGKRLNFDPPGSATSCS